MDKFSCPFQDCSKVYKCKSNLSRHLQAIHAENKRYQCDICEKVLSSSQNLREHKLLHSKILPFVCKEIGCGKRFRHGSQYSAHKRIHNFINNLMNNVDSIGTAQVFNKQLNEFFSSEKQFDQASNDVLMIEIPKIQGPQEFILPAL